MNPFTVLAVLFPILLILLAFASATTVDTGTVGAVYIFGRFWRVLMHGLNFVIPGIERYEIFSTKVHQHELPADPENIDRENENPLPDKKAPFRVLQSGKEAAIFYVKDAQNPGEFTPVHFNDLDPQKKAALGEDSLNSPLTSEIAGVVEWYLKEDRIREFIDNIQPEAGRTREEEVRKRLEDMFSRTLQELLSPVTLGHAREMMAYFSHIIKLRLEKLVNEGEQAGSGGEDRPWGIYIKDAYIKSIHPGRRVNEARADAAAAVSQKHATIERATATAESTKLQADADKHKEIAKGDGEAGRIAAMARVMADPNAKFLAELDVRERGYEAYEKNVTVTTYAPGVNAMLPLGK